MLSLEEAKLELIDLIAKVSSKDLPRLVEFLTDYVDSGTGTSTERIEGLKELKKIAKRLRKKVGISGELSSEKIILPLDGEFKGITANSLVDSFLYDELDLQELQKKQLVYPDRFCADCKSTNIKDTDYNSHSLGIDEVDWIFNELLPRFTTLDGKRLVDIGSRLGVVLYAAALFRPEIESIHGVEINPDFCAIQLETLKSLKNAAKCHVIHGDFLENLDPIQDADITLMNNVFTFFADNETQTKCWEALRKALTKGSLLVHAHSVKDVTSHLSLNFKLDDWLELLYPSQDQDLDNELDFNVYLYKII